MVNLHTGPVEREKKKLDFNLPFGPIENRLQTPDDLLGTEDVWLFLFHELIYVSDVPVAEVLVHAKTPETMFVTITYNLPNHSKRKTLVIIQVLKYQFGFIKSHSTER